MHRTTRKKDERGAILILSTVGLVLALIAGGLAVDVGFIAQEARDNQKVADLAAMDAVRMLPDDPTQAARDSAIRNGFTDVNPPNFVVETGTYSGGVFTASGLSGATAVRVSVTSIHDNTFPFLNDGQEVTRRGIATNEAMGGFSIGSSLATFDTARSGLLNRFMGGMLRGTGLDISAVSWSGLAGGNLTLEALRLQRASMGLAAGTVSEMLNTDVTMGQLLQASAQALALQGPTGVAQAAILDTLRTQATATTLTSFKLGRMISVEQGGEEMAAGSTLNVFQLVTGAAQVANGNHLVEVSSVGITVPNVVSTKVALKVIEPPKFYFGPVGGSVSTSQIELTVTPTLNLPVSVAGLANVVVTNTLPVKITGAGATGTLTAAECGTPPSMTVTVDPSAFSGSVGATLNARAYLQVLFSVVPIADIVIPTTNVVPTTDGGPTDLTFLYPSQFPPPLGTTTSQHAGSNPVGLNGLTQVNTGTPTVQLLTLTPLPVPVGAIVAAVKNALNPVLGNVDSLVLTPLLDVLGLDVGSGDVTALSLKCGTPTLIG
jgi:uncharacterized membrane protein